MTQAQSRTQGPNFWGGVWRLADPKVTLASVTAMVLGAGAAWYDGVLEPAWLALTALGIFCIEAGKNASGEIVDFRSGTDEAVTADDRSPFSGGKRVLVDGMMTSRQAAGVAAVFYLLGSAAGALIVWLREPSVLWFGVAGVALAFFYHAPPFKLSYRGFGEIAVAVTYGPLITAGTYLVQHHHVPPWVWLLSLPLGLLVGAFLWINEFPDYEADRSANKRTLVVRLGRPLAARTYAGIVGVAYGSLILMTLGPLPLGVLGGLAGLPLSIRAAARLQRFPESTPRIIPAQGWTLFAFVLHGVGATIGLSFSRGLS